MAGYLVTGGAGFIGSHLAEELVRRGHRVRVLDNFSTGKPENLAGLSGRIEIVEGDVRDPAACREAARGAEFVLHQAALISVPQSIADPVATHEVNVGGYLNVLLAAREAGAKRVVLASSTAVYGDEPGQPKREDMAPAPLSPYALTKLAGEIYGRAFTRIYGTQAVALRYFNVYGPRQDPGSAYAAAVPIFIDRLLDGRRPTIYGDGEQTRDFVYVADVVGANLLAAEAPGIEGQVFNVARGESVSINALARLIGEIVGREERPLHEPPRPGDIRHSLADISRARERFGYEPRTGLAEGLAATIAWHRERSGR